MFRHHPDMIQALGSMAEACCKNETPHLKLTTAHVPRKVLDSIEALCNHFEDVRKT